MPEVDAADRTILTADRLAGAARWLGVAAFGAVLAGALVIASLRSFDWFQGFAGAGYVIGGGAIVTAAGAALGALGLAIAARRLRRATGARGGGEELVAGWLGAVALGGTAALVGFLVVAGPGDYRLRQLRMTGRPVPELVAIATDVDRERARAAIVELGDRGTAAGVRAMLRGLRDTALAPAAHAALVRVGDDAVDVCCEALLDDDPGYRVAVRAVLRDLLRSGHVVVPPLRNRLRSDAPPVRRAAAWACVVLGEEVRQLLLDALSDADGEVQYAAAIGLCVFPNARNQWPLIPHILEREGGAPLARLRSLDPDIRSAGLRTLPHLGLPPAQVVAAVLERGEDAVLPQVLERTIAGLPESQLPELEELLILGLRHDASRAVAARALGWLGPDCTPAGWRALVAALDAPDVATRPDAASQDLPAWAEATGRFVDGGARSAVIWAILQCGKPEDVVAALTPLLRTGSTTHRLQAAAAVADRGDAGVFRDHVVPAVAELIPELKDAECGRALGLLARRAAQAGAARTALLTVANDADRGHHVQMLARAVLEAMDAPAPRGAPPVAGD